MKYERGYRLKPKYFRSSIRVLSDVPVSRNGYKTVSNLYENLTDHIQQIHNQSENDDIPEEPKVFILPSQSF